MGGDGLGQADQDTGAVVVHDRAGGGDPAVHGLDEPLGDGETETGALGAVGLLVHAAEFVEHPFQLGRGDALAFVLDADDHRTPIFNALVIVALIPLALRGVKYRAIGAGALLSRNLLIYGLGGLIAPFVGIKLIDVVISGLGLA